MTEWQRLDGENQHGPMDRHEPDARIQNHPGAVCVRPDGCPDRQTVEDALDVNRTNSSIPSTSEQPQEPTGRPKHQNFIVKNWRGEYPLWVSYWIIGILCVLFVKIVISGARIVTASQYNPLNLFAFAVLYFSLLAFIGIWQSVGIWRSAGRRIAKLDAMGRSALWPVVARVTVCLGGLLMAPALVYTGIPQLTEFARMAFMDDPAIPSYSIRIMNNGSEVEIAGGIKFGLSRDVEKILNASNGVRVVHLNSNGGRVGEGIKLNALIRSRALDTYVDTACMSACTLAFVAGHQRILKKGARLGFHRSSFAGEELNDNSERPIYAAAGISSSFIDRAVATSHAKLWRPSESELVSAGVVTKVSSGDEYALAGFGGALTRNDWDKNLQAMPLYRALKQRHPKSYEEILDVISNGTAKGATQAEVLAQGGAKLADLLLTLLPSADDTVLLDFGRLALDMFRALRSQDSAACYKAVSGTHDLDVVRLLPPALAKRELEVNERIIMSAGKQVSSSDGDPPWDKILADFRSKGHTTEDFDLLSDDTVSPADYARYCGAAIALYEVITDFPPKEAAAALRWIFSQLK